MNEITIEKLRLLKQNQFVPLPIENQIVMVFAGVKGYLDKNS